MANEKRLIDAYKLEDLVRSNSARYHHVDDVIAAIAGQPTVDAVEMPDTEMLKAINMLIKQYEHSKQSDYVRNPIAHAFFHTWKQLDESGYGERKDNEYR